MIGWIIIGGKYLIFTILGLVILVALYIAGINFFTTPRLDRNWALDQKILPTVSWSGSTATIANVRNFEYRSTDDYTPRYYTGSYRLEDLESAYYIIEPFSAHTGPAHTMISFGFKGGQYVTVSAEIRKEVGESFGPVNGLLAKYEIVYIIGDERDLVGLRANHRKDRVFMYPVRAPITKLAPLFTSMINRADALGREPEWYNLIWNTCTTSILAHINALREEPIPWGYRVFMPYHSDEIAIENDLIDTSLPLAEARAYYQINDLAAEFANDPEFSVKIRKERK
jgi:Domain of unknown function (DUF4105)